MGGRGRAARPLACDMEPFSWRLACVRHRKGVLPGAFFSAAGRGAAGADFDYAAAQFQFAFLPTDRTDSIRKGARAETDTRQIQISDSQKYPMQMTDGGELYHCRRYTQTRPEGTPT